ncbi:hypothetical protein ACRB8A_14810 [Arthrobacter sp. G.S.26]|uniref:hypothetical protein n=1 Tax=Arthrobacter sp. G.S.26 TaxID=3433706 RepID=UPI003D78ABC7
MPKPALLLAALPLLLSACAAPTAAEPSQPAATPHGYVAGAQENPEPQTGLLTVDSATGEARLLSLLTGDTSDAGRFGKVDALHQDGRYALVTTPEHVEVFDTGAWTVDHGDHAHYYSSEPRTVGTIEVPDPGSIAGDGKDLAVFSDTGGYAAVFRHKDLDAGSIDEAFRITTSAHRGMVVPYEGHFIASVAAEGSAVASGVEVRDDANATVLARQDCQDPAASATTRVGVVLACADAALLITEEDGTFAAERIPYPAANAGVPAATSLEHRAGSNELAGPAGDAGVWHLDVSARAWTLLPTPARTVAASAVGDTRRVLALGVDGVLRTLDPRTGAVTAEAPLLAPLTGSEPAVPALRVDASRAYLSDPAGSRVLELDYADGLRAARTFDVPAADLVLETGL